MVLIPGGPFVMGADERDGPVGIRVGVDSVPRHTRTLAPFWIDRHEVTNAEYRVFILATDRPVPADPRFPEFFSWKEGDFPPGLANHPAVYVSWDDAEAYCSWRGARLPSEAEWEKAARGTDGRDFPWGGIFEADRCNTLESDIGWTAPVGTLEGDISPYGVMDMCGNVSEWTSSWYQAYPGSTLDREAFGEKYKVTRGGSWKLAGDPYSRVTNRTLAFEPSKRHRAIGFRCARSAEGDGDGR